MKLIYQSVEEITQGGYSINDILYQIERSARTCYKSIGSRYFMIKKSDDIDVTVLQRLSKANAVINDAVIDGEDTLMISLPSISMSSFKELKIYETDKTKYHLSATSNKFVDNLIKNEHTAMLEHGAIYLTYDKDIKHDKRYDFFIHNPYSRVREDDKNVYISTNYRVIIENDLEDELRYLSPLSDMHEKIFSFKIITNRAIANEFVRHRKMSFCQESTRFCNYSKDKFGKEITFIIPHWIKDEQQVNVHIDYDNMLYNNQLEKDFKEGLLTSEKKYFDCIENNLEAQDARDILALALKTELIMTGYRDEWYPFFKLRDDPKAHKMAQELAHEIKRYIK